MRAGVDLMSPALVAHQGGWDEILMVAGPILLIAGVLAVVKRRVDRNYAADEAGSPVVGDATTPDEPSDHDDQVGRM